MIKMIASDLDGTLFDDQKNISDNNRKAVAEAAAHGISFVPVTGRPFGAIPDNVRSLPGVRYIAAASGAVIVDLEKDEIIHEALIPNALMLEILKTLVAGDYVVMVFIDGVGYVSREGMERAIEMAPDDATRRYYRQYRVSVDDLYEFTRSNGRDVEKFTVNFPYDDNGKLIGEAACREVLRPFENELHMVSGGNINLEVGCAEAHKGAALDVLAVRLGIENDEILALGDSGNDSDMVGHCGIFAAVANGEDTLKAMADRIVPANGEDGVAVAIRELALGDTSQMQDHR
ncbi:MAG: HAD-IIB family hydrolase [Lachnospiraceae bacterium]|nr:HAD-IIB family hydrolase [Lachnospiraceae bacterium]